MSFFNPKVPIKEKPATIHPWEHRIKAKFFSTYKYSHNCVHNPLYPLPPTENALDTELVTFIVIGNRVTKEFIYCLHLVRGLHKHRKKEFGSPVIRGVTSVEWPKVWNDLKLQFGTAAYCIKSQVAVLINKRFLGGENELKEFIESKYTYPYPKYLDYYKKGIEQFANYVKSNGRPCAYLHIAINDVPIGPLIFMLYVDIVPLTCQNFISLCELTKGGYVGTPIHRIVQDCWIQCGGFALKNPIELDCENYIVPHDRRGVLGMANDGRNKDCSTQFFVLLQPAHWMNHKYVAFGQLIEGERTLKQIEDVPTWYESPTAKITIYKAGVFNMECQWRPINKTATEYISGHIEDLVQLGILFYEALLEKVFEEIESKIKAEDELLEEEEQTKIKQIHPPKRFKRNKRDIEKELRDKSSRYMTPANSTVSRAISTALDDEEYQHEMEEDVFPEHASMSHDVTPKTSTKVLEQPYYLPLTDVAYPGEVESAFNLQRLLRGDYCLETDLVVERDERKKMYFDQSQPLTVPEDLLDALFECVEPGHKPSDTSLESDEEREIQEYINENVDSTSFGGDAIKKIANMQDKYKILKNVEERKKKDVYTDEHLRLLRLATVKLKNMHRKKVSISKNTAIASHTRINRRQTGFVRPEQIDKLEEILAKLMLNDNNIEDKESEVLREVGLETTTPTRRSTNQTKSFKSSSDFQDTTRRSVLIRLYNELSSQDLTPTLKHLGERRESNHFAYLTQSAYPLAITKESKEKMYVYVERQRVEDTLHLQHGHKLSRKVSSDYANTLNRFEEAAKSSIRSVEYARNRPSISVVEYKLINQKYQDDLKAASKEQLESNKST